MRSPYLAARKFPNPRLTDAEFGCDSHLSGRMGFDVGANRVAQRN